MHQSSDIAERGFCRNCGSRLVYRPLGSQTIALEVGSLDQPEDAPPTYHAGVESEIFWFIFDDQLPRKSTNDHDLHALIAEHRKPRKAVPGAAIVDTKTLAKYRGMAGTGIL